MSFAVLSQLPVSVSLDTLPEAPAWARALRRQGGEHFNRVGLPTRKLESWRYTSLPTQSGAAGTSGAIPAPLISNASRFVFVNGVLDRGLSSPGELPEGAIAGAIDDMDLQGRLGSLALLEEPVTALNTALFSGGFALVVPKGVALASPVEILFHTTGGNVNTRLLVLVEDGAEAVLVERHSGAGAHTLVSEISVGANARLGHYRLQSAVEGTIRLATSTVQLQRDSTYDAFAATSGSALTRHQVKATLAGPGATVHLNGVHALDGGGHADTATEIVHAVPHCASRETYRHVVDGNSRSVFQGKIYVAKDAQKTDGFQLNQSLMLSPNAEVDAKPELEIYADDVKCSHGATSGKLDEEALFYLRSRGLPEGQARAMLIEAFLGSAIDLIAVETVREAFRKILVAGMATGDKA